MQADSQTLSDMFSQRLGRMLFIAVSCEPIKPEHLGTNGQHMLSKFRYEKRRQEWLCGRNALKQVMRTVGDKTDPDGLVFPHQRYSLTHSNGKAIAVANVDGQLAGIGIDYEAKRVLKPGMERFFLTSHEQKVLQANPTDESQLLCLWTIKEALFKADSWENQHLLKDYSLQQPIATEGAITLRGRVFHYCSIPLDGGFISVATSNPDKNV
jgi:4'-phosphopantetheinyl transferase EntD